MRFRRAVSSTRPTSSSPSTTPFDQLPNITEDLRIIEPDGDDQDHIAGCNQRLLKGIHHAREGKRDREFGITAPMKPECAASAALGRGIGHVAQPSGHLLHPCAHLDIDRIGVIQHARHGLLSKHPPPQPPP